ncbi:MAG TPA: sodium:proton antiporter [Tepidisphaeraceae bacterium]|jgi:Na+/H+ antiporter NhaD/arsenite permease-like protein|nr:sodium:proton antiporter [Tepidisphaeraceae bacterium]
MPPEITSAISPFWLLPFVAMLGCIALMPFINKHWWEKHYPKVSLGLALLAAVYYFVWAPSVAPWVRYMEEYASFIILLASLYVVSGGILIRITRKATPLANCALLLIGGVAANIFGTTGASMLLIRPYIRMNRNHIRPFHIVFFIFIVSNVGGALTPIGDPPLFLGYLHGVPFWWVFEHCRPMWLTAIAILLIVFFIIDTIEHGKFERYPDEDAGPAVGILGIHNFLFIMVILFAVFQDGFFDVIRRIHETGVSLPLGAKLIFNREILMLAAAGCSQWLTATEIHEKNGFNYGAIKEVAILFVGIFSTMVPALTYLNQNVHRFPLHKPGSYYFSSGALSSLLDNAPTYLTFLEMRLGALDRDQVDQAYAEVQAMSDRKTLDVRPNLEPVEVREAVETVVRNHPEEVLAGTVSLDHVETGFLVGVRSLNAFIVAISLGSVFFGACTYIGNGPNFMVKSIADAAGATTPSFIGYVVKFVLPILLPTYVLIWWIFLRT